MKNKAFTMFLLFFAASAMHLFADKIIPTRHIRAGDNTRYFFEIVNSTAEEHTYSIKTVSPDKSIKIKVESSNNTNDVQNFLISSGKRGEVTVEVSSLPETPVGCYDGELHVKRDDGKSYSISFSLTVENPYILKTTGAPDRIDVFSGKEFSFNVTVINSGAALLHNLIFKIDAPPKWIIMSEPKILDRLDPGNNVVIKTRVIVPPSQASVIQSVPYHIECMETVSSTGTLTVKVQKSPEYLITALAVLVLAIAGTILFFKKKGRR